MARPYLKLFQILRSYIIGESNRIRWWCVIAEDQFIVQFPTSLQINKIEITYQQQHLQLVKGKMWTEKTDTCDSELSCKEILTQRWRKSRVLVCSSHPLPSSFLLVASVANQMKGFSLRWKQPINICFIQRSKW